MMWRDKQEAIHELSGHRQRLIKLLRNNRVDGLFDNLIKALRGEDVDFEKCNFLVMVQHLDRIVLNKDMNNIKIVLITMGTF